jgi:hypothetical protein
MAKTKKDNEDQPDKNSGNADDSSDNFGLPDIEYKPLDRQSESQAVSDPAQEPRFERSEESGSEPPDYSYEDDEPNSKAPVVIGLIIGVVILVAGFLIYKYWYVPKAEKEKQERVAREVEEKRKADEIRLAQEKAEEERKALEAEAAAKTKPAEGTIETLSDRTRRYFVVVTSNIDDDLVMDYAKKLSSKGVSSKIIPPFGKTKFYRLAIADFDSFNAAQSSADAFKAEYGSALWVIKY